MQTRRLGQTDLQVPLLSFGASSLGAEFRSVTIDEALTSVRVALDPDRDLRPGAFARGRIEVGKGLRPVLPQTSVLSDIEGNFVYVVDAQGAAQRRSVTLGQARPEGVVVAAGLSDGERVVTTAGAYLRAGEKVRLAAQ